MELHIDKELEKLYENEFDDLEYPPKFKFIPTNTIMKKMILSYVQSTLF